MPQALTDFTERVPPVNPAENDNSIDGVPWPATMVVFAGLAHKYEPAPLTGTIAYVAVEGCPISVHTFDNPLIAAGVEGAFAVTVRTRAALTEHAFRAVTDTVPDVKPTANRVTIPVSPRFATRIIPEDNVHA